MAKEREMELLEHWGATWWVQALVIAAFTAVILNGCPFLPFFRDIKPRRIEARWVGYVGLTSAFGLWLVLGPHRPAWQAVAAWVIIMVATLVPNTLGHLRDRDTKDIRLLLTKEGEVLLERWLRDHAPDDSLLRSRFESEQTKETAEERWLDAMAPWAGMLGEFDSALACCGLK